MLRRFALPCLLCIAPLAAQTPPCDALNDTTLTLRPLRTFNGLNTWAYRIVAQNTQTVRAIRILTENRLSPPNFMALEIRENDPYTQLPAATALGRGVWHVDATRGEAWQGTNLDRPVPLSGGTDYWVVWQEPGGSVLPFHPDAYALAVPAARFSGGSWSSIGTSKFRVRLYCGLLDDAGVVPFGNPCASATGTEGTAITNEAAVAGNAAFAVEGTGFPLGAISVLMIGVNPGWVSVPLGALPPGCAVNTDILATVVGITGTGTVYSSAPDGHVLYPLPLPAAASGAFLSTAIGVVDAGATATIPLVTSNALQLTIQ
ncbi:MAG: hypothetical protein AAF628_24660 [Planctomycetota bacterium]